MTTTPRDETPPASRERTRFTRGLLTTLPLVLAGSMAMSLNLTGPVAAVEHPDDKDKPGPTELGKTIRESLAAAHAASIAEATSVGAPVVAAVAPSTYRVVAGDSVSGIAGRYGLATASVLALNGLGWKSVIFPGQVLTLGAAAPVSAAPISAAPVAAGSYTIVSGDTIAKIAARFQVPTASLLAANGLGWSSIIYAGRTLTIPPQSSAASASQARISPPAAIVPVASITPAPGANPGHVIKANETVGSIARSYGVTVQAVLSANGLGWSSIIYSGRTLVIPSVVASAPVAPGVTPMSSSMAQNARTIIAVGRSLGVNDRGLIIALATAMQESSLENLDYGDRDSLGLFQQRPSTGWGTPAQVTDPVYAAKLFFGGPANPNRGITRGLLDIPSWQSISLTQAAQAVQLSAYPDAYAKWETSATAWLDQLT